MKTFRLLIVTVALVVLSGGTVEAQFLRRLGNAAQNAAERAVTRNTERAVEKAVDKAMDPDTYSNKDEEQQQQQEPQGAENSGDTEEGVSSDTATPTASAPRAPTVQTPEMVYAKSDFVAGDEIIFEDNLAGEQLGEFPSMWDLLGGNAEIAKLNGENVILFVEGTMITPLMKIPKNYLSDSYTVEFDFYMTPDIGGYWKFQMRDPDSNYYAINYEWYAATSKTRAIETSWKTITGENRRSNVYADLSRAGWHHLALSFNKRALKLYIDGIRVVNAPNVAQAGWFTAESVVNGATGYYLRNIRIAKGAVPLYDRMMSDGKFITYGITFDVGKSTIKPESMGEINRIVTLMTENPDLRFSVEGHTDSTGNAASNQTLSEARSQAIVAKLTELGIAADRLSASGKGQSSPIADNATDEGRAKNRRVEFVKQ